MNANEMAGYRRQKDQFYKTSPQSPLTPEQQDKFQGLRYFEHDPALNLVVDAERLTGDVVYLETTSGDSRQYRRYARFNFEVDGESAALTIYETPHGFFMPFIDASDDTYGGGRYLEPELLDETPDTARFEVDFNLAYSPYCAFGDGWSCPLVPLENRVKVAINAGEKIPEIS